MKLMKELSKEDSNFKMRKGKQKQLWADAEFVRWLKKLKAKKEIEGDEVGNLGELTRQMLDTEAIKEVERQMIQNKIKLKIDGRLI